MSGNVNVRETPLQKTLKLVEFDKSFCAERLAGVDEAGRGPLVGPVAVCACRMPLDIPIAGIDDSKKLSEKKREMLYEQIIEVADYCVVMIDENTIDRLNILGATKLGMKKAVEGLRSKPSLVIVDAVKGLDISVPYSSVIKADAKSYCTAAASVIAKVTRDRFMREIDIKYPQYGFARNKGYGTKEHIDALLKYGPCPYHRSAFIKNFVNINDETGKDKFMRDKKAENRCSE